MQRTITVACVLILNACTGVPDNIAPVQNFDLNKYQGKWYEIARLDHSFERGLEQITAEYSLNSDGSVKVLNRGFSTEEQQWQQAQGKAKFVDEKTQGHLKVSFFGPFYGSYIVFKLDQENYQYAYVTSYSKDYLWLLSRSPQVSEQQLEDFKNTAQRYGFKTDELIYVQHNNL
ncbi:lipocalin family protein [Pseudoalteromonas mariniglutinosa]|uniref:lipocalin family protein n=1 Tax=Pseudoalteromonas mariniglutinosa TaxID=206042 RepID=UPI00384DDC12